MADRADAVIVTLSRLPPEVDGAREWLEDVARGSEQIAGAGRARVLEAVDERGNWVSLHDTDIHAASELVSYIRAREAADDGARLVGSALRRAVQTYEAISVPPDARGRADTAGELVSCVWWTPSPDAEDDFNAWYDAEHIPLLMEVPGWLRIRRFKIVGGEAPRYLAIHDIEHARVLDDPRRKRVRTTAWRDRVVRCRLQYEARMYRTAD